MELIAEDADFFGCTSEIEHACAIAREGTSADRQRAVFAQAREKGAEEDEALRAVVRSLVDETAL